MILGVKISSLSMDRNKTYSITLILLFSTSVSIKIFYTWCIPCRKVFLDSPRCGLRKLSQALPSLVSLFIKESASRERRRAFVAGTNEPLASQHAPLIWHFKKYSQNLLPLKTPGKRLKFLQEKAPRQSYLIDHD